MTNQDVYLGAWWDQSRYTYVLLAADGHDHTDIVDRVRPEALEVRHAAQPRSYYAPAFDAFTSYPPQRPPGLLTSATLDPTTATFRIRLSDVSIEARRQVTNTMPSLDGMCFEPDTGGTTLL